ncbi:hypothetical protein [Clostridium perfringens]|uniref:hypothetical protein n=1 Tax=Clostridium perfringens TaxID=1502 RepID=UPI0001663F6E|nr:hypothetical protein [Clostridium perfringens]EDS79191.1 conserved hypothetical protein [Clostridium perfringens C str. JGS1495]ELC8449538.1 hypothetical protein [Clostridium perfringens]MBI6029103.1 hypothetical protein [Clostridium perfringens]MBI6032609.1 hypothetical protein [Clostridium perfringens]MBI6067177.1 hypothetical protein [Clostridium perfringens]
MNYKHIKDLKARHSKEVFEDILLALDQDLKFNKLRFDKRITNEQFKTLISSTECVFRRIV